MPLLGDVGGGEKDHSFSITHLRKVGRGGGKLGAGPVAKGKGVSGLLQIFYKVALGRGVVDHHLIYHVGSNLRGTAVSKVSGPGFYTNLFSHDS